MLDAYTITVLSAKMCLLIAVKLAYNTREVSNL